MTSAGTILDYIVFGIDRGKNLKFYLYWKIYVSRFDETKISNYSKLLQMMQMMHSYIPIPLQLTDDVQNDQRHLTGLTLLNVIRPKYYRP